MAIFKVKYRKDKLSPCGKYHDSEALYDVIDYCLAPEKTPHHYIGGAGVSIHQAAFEMELLSRAFGQEKGVRLRHFILSFSQDEMRWFRPHVYETLYEIGWCTVSYYRNKYQIIFAVHEDKCHPHIHFVMNTVSFATGLKYNGRDNYREFKKFLRDLLWGRYHLGFREVSDRI